MLDPFGTSFGVHYSYFKLYEKQDALDLCIDIMLVNEMPFLTSITKALHYRMAQVLPTRKKKDLYAAIDDALRVGTNVLIACQGYLISCLIYTLVCGFVYLKRVSSESHNACSLLSLFRLGYQPTQSLFLG